jgi:predicted RNase H-like HicB family nuclease
MDAFDRQARLYPVTVSPDPDGDGFVADAADFPGVCAGGATPSEALACAYDGIASVLAVMTRHGDPIPQPAATAA